jgi:2-phosphoglycerate kinase
MSKIPNDLILMLSGVPCVGKTTVAYNLIKMCSDFRRVSELDIIRNIIRKAFDEFQADIEPKDSIISEKYLSLFASLSESDYTTAKKQSTLLIPYIKEIVIRQQARRIPTIIEGTSIVPSTYFQGNNPIAGFEKNVVFINLFISDEEEHLKRRIERCRERGYEEDYSQEKEWLKRIRKEKNIKMHQDSITLSQNNKFVFSIDISQQTPSKTCENIIQLLSTNCF